MAPNRPNRAISLPAGETSSKTSANKERNRRAKSVWASPHLVELNSHVEALLGSVPEIETGRISVLGNGGVGKSSLVRLLAFGQFLREYTPTVSEVTIPAFALFRIREPIGFAQRKISRSVRRTFSNHASATQDVDLNRKLTTSDFEAVIARGSQKLGPVTDFQESSASDPRIIRSMNMLLTDCVHDFKGQSPMAYKACISNSYAFVLVVSTDDPSSVSAARAAYSDIVTSQPNMKRPIILVVNKCDIPDEEKKVDWDVLQDLSRSLNIPRVDVSCKNKYGIDQVLVNLAALASQFNSNRASVLEESVSDDYIFVSEEDRQMKPFRGACIIS